MKTTDYLNQLIKDKQTLVDNLKAKFIQADNNETFTALVAKVGLIDVKTHLWEEPGNKEYIKTDDVCYIITKKCTDEGCDAINVTEFEHNWRNRPSGIKICRECNYTKTEEQ